MPACGWTCWSPTCWSPTLLLNISCKLTLSSVFTCTLLLAGHHTVALLLSTHLVCTVRCLLVHSSSSWLQHAFHGHSMKSRPQVNSQHQLCAAVPSVGMLSGGVSGGSVTPGPAKESKRIRPGWPIPLGLAMLRGGKLPQGALHGLAQQKA